MERIFAEAERQGVRIELAPMLPWERGRYYDEERLIRINPGLSTKQMRATCWHELAHAHYRDTTDHPAIESRADRWAARMAIEPEQYAEAELVNPDVGFIATELGLPTYLVRLWQNTWAPSFHERAA